MLLNFSRFVGKIGPQENLELSDSESCESNSVNMVVDEILGQKHCDKLLGLVKAAEDDMKKVKAIYDNPLRKTALFRAMQSRLETWNESLIKQEKEVQTYRGRSIDISITASMHSIHLSSSTPVKPISVSCPQTNFSVPDYDVT